MFVTPGATIVTHPDLLLKPVAVCVLYFLVPVAVAFDRAIRPVVARAILANGERPHSISRLAPNDLVNKTERE